MSAINSLSLVDRRGYLTVVLEVEKEDSMVVRRSEDVRDWYNIMQRVVKESKKKEMKATKEFWKKVSTVPDDKILDERSIPTYHVSLDRARHRRRDRGKKGLQHCQSF